MLDNHNVLVKSFRRVREAFDEDETQQVNLRLIGKRSKDGRMYNLPTTDEVAMLIVGDIENLEKGRDIIVRKHDGMLQQINEHHPAYLALQYPLLFPYGDDGYTRGIGLRLSVDDQRKRTNLTMREYMQYRLHTRLDEADTILCARKLLQQFLVDAYTMVESERLWFIRRHQKALRADLYKGLTDAVLHGETTPSSRGKRIILPSSFTGGARYMMQNYQDAMAICRWAGFPDFFLTFTCNPKWPEIVREASAIGLRTEDCPIDIVRVFKIKLDNLVKDLTHKKIFGRVKASKTFNNICILLIYMIIHVNNVY